MKPTVTYVYDALCGWCYGFSPTIEQLADALADDYAFEVVSGGMIVGPRVGPIGEVAPYIRRAYRDVERATGVRFGRDFLEGTLAEGTAVFTSVPPAVALAIVREARPEAAVPFAGALQRAIYHDGIAPADPAAYAPYAAPYGFAADAFVRKMNEPRYHAAAEADFQRAQQLGVRGFPTVLLRRDDQYYPLAHGYTDAATLRERLRRQTEDGKQP